MGSPLSKSPEVPWESVGESFAGNSVVSGWWACLSLADLVLTTGLTEGAFRRVQADILGAAVRALLPSAPPLCKDEDYGWTFRGKPLENRASCKQILSEV